MPISIAVVGLTTESMGAASTGMSNVYASIVQLTDTSCGSRVRLLGTIAMAGGASLDRTRMLVERALAEHEITAEAREVEEVLALSRAAGVPASELLRAEAAELRAAARSSAQERAAALSVRLMLPLGLCVLPAFLALGVVPLLATVVTSTVDSF